MQRIFGARAVYQLGPRRVRPLNGVRHLTDGATSISFSPDALKHNRQLVGRLLGNVVRDSRGTAVYEKVENIRKLCVAFRRTIPGSLEAQALKLQLDVLFSGSIEERIDIIRAFTFFSHLSNIAEDVGAVHGRVESAGRGSRKGSFAAAIAQIRESTLEPSSVEAWLDNAIIAPVLTAHPTEVGVLDRCPYCLFA